MSSRLAKSTSKFRPVKPQPKKAGTGTGTGTPTSSVAPSSSGRPSPAPQAASTPLATSLSSTPLAVGNSIALTQEDGIPSASIPNIQPSASPQISLQPPASAQTSAASEQLSAPSASSHAPSSTIPLPSSSIPPEPTPTATPQTHTQESQLRVPSEAPSRQGTPIASSVSLGSWQEAEPTQVPSVSPSAPVPDTQATIVDSQDKEASVEYVTDKESALAEKEASHVAVIEPPNLPDIRQSEAIPPLPSSGSQITPSIPFDISTLPPLPVPQPAQPAGATTNGEDAEAQGEDNYADDGEAAAEDAMEVANEAPQPAKKKRGRPAGSKTAKKTQAKRKGPAKKGAATTTEAVEEEEEEEEGQTSPPAVGGEGDIEVPAESAAPTKKRKTYTKRKTPAKKAKKSKKNSAGDRAAEDGAEEDEDDEEEVEPWNIAKTRPGYSLATSDIYAAIGIAPPTSFQFTTAQDLAEMPHEEEEEEEEENEERQGDESMRNEYDDDQYDENGEYDDQDRQDHGTTPWHPLKRAIDPTITTMRQLTEDTGRGRITPSLHKDMIDKIDRKQKLKLARETMKLRQSLKKAGLKGEVVERTLKIKIEEIMQGGILEFDERLDWSNNASQEENGYSINSNTLVRFANGDADAAEEMGNGTNAHAGPSSDAYNNEEDTQSQHHDQREGTEGAEEEDGFEGMAESHYGPQVRVVDGELVVDEASTQIVRDDAAREAFATVEDDDKNKRINSASFAKRGTSSRWTMADTDLFYEGLTQFGTDFELISRMFSNRTRRQIKAKFVREEKLDPTRLEEALSGKRKKIDIHFYERMTKLDFTQGVVPADPMAKFYEGLPTLENAVKLESNREPSPGQELDLAALLRKKKEDTAGPGGGWENSRPQRDYQGDGGEAIPEEDEGEEGGQQYEGDQAVQEGQGEHDEHDEQMEDQGDRPLFRSPTPDRAEEEPFDFSGGIQLRVSA